MSCRIIYVSVDMEADGPVPGKHSMLSLGADARFPDGTKLGTFSINLMPLPDATTYPNTMNWWAKHPQAWLATKTEQIAPTLAMQHFLGWLETLENNHKAKVIFVAYPISFDFYFVVYYAQKFLGHDPFAGRIVDMRSMVMGTLGVDYDEAGKAHMPDEWNANAEMTHVAVEDATQQADLFFRMRAASRSKNI